MRARRYPLSLCLSAFAAGTAFAAEPLKLDPPAPTECASPVVRRCPPPAPAAPPPPAAKAEPKQAPTALERERQAQATQELLPIVIYGDRQQKTIQEVFDANLRPRGRLSGETRNFDSADGRRCTQIVGLGYAECTPSANAPPATGFSSAFTAGKP